MTVVLRLPAARVRDIAIRTIKTFIAAVAAAVPFNRWLTLAGQPLPAVYTFALPPVIAGITAVGNYWLHVNAESKSATARKAAADLQALAAAVDKAAEAKVPAAVQKILDGLAASGSLAASQATIPADTSSQPSTPPSLLLPVTSPTPTQA